MSKQVQYCRRGWKAKVHTLAELDKKTGLCKLANEAGEIVVSELPYVENPAEIDPAELPKSYACPIGAPEPAKKSRKKSDADGDGAGEGGEGEGPVGDGGAGE